MNAAKPANEAVPPEVAQMHRRAGLEDWDGFDDALHDARVTVPESARCVYRASAECWAEDEGLD